MSINGILDTDIRCAEGLGIALSYVESERWGGLGAQAAVLRRQVVVFGPGGVCASCRLVGQ